MPHLSDFAAYTVLGLAFGGIFALAALGIVLVYRVTGVLNFAHGAMGMVSTFIAWQVAQGWGLKVGCLCVGPMEANGHRTFELSLSAVVAALAALLFSLALGLFLEFVVFRHLVGRPQLVKAVATVGLLLGLQALATLLWGNNNYHQPIKFFPDQNVVTVPLPRFGAAFDQSVNVQYNQILVIVAALVMAALLALLLQYTRFGVAMRAVSDDPVAASLWGVPINIVGAASWMLGSLTAAIAGILVTPFVQFDTVGLTILVLDALAAALIGGLVSLPLTLAGGFILGLLETYPHLFINSSGFPRLVALLVILAVLLVRAPRGLLATAR
jgi:branched-chain amino acid transport system permease protein